jgi:rare lipoprotein A
MRREVPSSRSNFRSPGIGPAGRGERDPDHSASTIATPFLKRASLALAAAIVFGCAGPGPDRAPKRPPDLSRIPDAVPRTEPRSASGNPTFYEVFGRRYYVLDTASGYRERGIASWYGEKFHGRRTSSGEPYDMYAMTAAHKTLPLPAYVRVTNLQNGKSVVVRVNDRGPFVDNRLIDLSYAAAVKLDMTRSGTAMVEIESIGPSSRQQSAQSRPTPLPEGGMFIQAGAFRSEANAQSLVRRIEAEVPGKHRVFVKQDRIDGQPIYRVRVGPVSGVADFDAIVAQMARIGIPDAYLALD